MSIDDTFPDRPTAPTRHVSEPGTRGEDTASSRDSPDRSTAELKAEIAALERALAESEHRRQAIIDQYELILAERESSDDTDDGPRRVRNLRSWFG